MRCLMALDLASLFNLNLLRKRHCMVHSTLLFPLAIYVRTLLYSISVLNERAIRSIHVP